MATVAEILKASGMTETEIAALDARVMSGITATLTTASQEAEAARAAKEAAELADRSQRDLYDKQIAPALNNWGNEKATLEAQIAFYKTQAESAKTAGFIAKDAPGYVPPAAPARGANGEFVPNAGGVPGSPAFMTKDEGFRAVSNASYVISEHLRLYGQPAPDDIDTIAREAEAQRMSFRDYAAKKYNFEGKKAEMAATREKEARDKIIADTIKERDQFWAERSGGNPNVNVGVPSQFTELRKGVEAKTIADPLSQSKAERHAATQQMIQKEIAQNMGGTVH